MAIETKCKDCGSLVLADNGVLRRHNTPHLDARAGRCNPSVTLLNRWTYGVPDDGASARAAMKDGNFVVELAPGGNWILSPVGSRGILASATSSALLRKYALDHGAAKVTVLA